VLGPKSRNIGADLGISPVSPEKTAYPGTRIAEQCFMDEFDGCGRALDVQQDRADALQRDAVRSGMYVGPIQSG
jgi:hypothetical protein